MVSTRGRYMKDYLAAVRRLPPSKQEAVLTGLEPVVEQIEQASTLDWLPMTLNLQLTSAVYRELGAEPAHTFYQNWFKRQMSAPLFAGLVRTALAVFRFDTAAIARWIPKAFDLMYRDYGTLAVEATGPEQVELTFSEVPDELMAHDPWQRSVCSGLYALFFLTGVKGSVELAAVDAPAHALRIVLRWSVG